MQGLRFEFCSTQEPWIYLILSLVLLTAPISWIVAWIISVVFHETGHLLMAKLLSVPVYGMRMGVMGAKIDTAPMDLIQELLCAAAGPLAGCLLLLLRRWLPLTALFAFFHTVWNLLPVGASDGARMARCISGLVRKIPCKPGRERVQ